MKMARKKKLENLKKRHNNIAGTTTKRYYTNTIPAGKTISVAYNKGPYMVVDAKDFKTMGKKV